MTMPTSTCTLRGLPSRLWPLAASSGGPLPSTDVPPFENGLIR
jgi:hypothetical protein